MSDDFQMRRELLLTRLDVTIQSFKWAERLKECNNEISNIYSQKRKELQSKQTIKIYEIIAARDGYKYNIFLLFDKNYFLNY